MKYEDLKARFNQFSKCDETYVTIPREYLLTLIGELLRLRRRDGARAHQGKINDARANC
ncbi:hypothetical protein [Phascolarctobacterium succinatutens]|uniref:hypothetical protein n=1 Tax=Phascolarctobacterium succinatutens TaxID=626940 RepID=UPI0026EADBEA|nr:hypothetical protein [Phascolarctobacterium succinatutens]